MGNELMMRLRFNLYSNNTNVLNTYFTLNVKMIIEPQRLFPGIFYQFKKVGKGSFSDCSLFTSVCFLFLRSILRFFFNQIIQTFRLDSKLCFHDCIVSCAAFYRSITIIKPLWNSC